MLPGSTLGRQDGRCTDRRPVWGCNDRGQLERKILLSDALTSSHSRGDLGFERSDLRRAIARGALWSPELETDAVISREARSTVRYETGREPDEVAALATFNHEENGLGAIIPRARS